MNTTTAMMSVAQTNVGKSATPVTPVTRLMDTLRARRKRERDQDTPVGDLKESPKLVAVQSHLSKATATVESLSNKTDAVNTSPGRPIRHCLGCGNPFAPSAQNKVYCRAKCWSTPKAVLKPTG